MEKEQTMTPQEFDHKLKHEIPADQRKQWAEENKHRIVYPKPTLVQQAGYKWATEFPGDSWKDHLKEAFEAGAEYIQKESGKQWTDEDLLRFGGGVLDIVNTEPTKEIVKAMSEWLQYYKENRGK